MRLLNTMHTQIRTSALILSAMVLFALPAHAMLADRYLVGIKLRAFEVAWESQPNETMRKNAAATLEPLTFTFLSGNLSRAAQLLDQATTKLVEIPESDRWIQPVAVRVTQPLIDLKNRQIKGKYVLIYKPQAAIPPEGSIQLLDQTGKPLSKPIPVADLAQANLDFTATLPEGIQAGPYKINYQIAISGNKLAGGAISLFIVNDLGNKLESLGQKAESVRKLPPSIGRSTWLLLQGRVNQAAQGKDQETDYPLASWLTDLDQGFDQVCAGKMWPAPDSPSPLWLALPMGQTDKVIRIEGANRDGKTPLTCVVALHGAGGSENLFCEGHGALAPKLAVKNGWLLASPLNGPTDDLLDKLATWHPIDKSRVVTVGHSMGAANATAWAARKPEQLRAVAALGGGGRAGKGEPWKKLPYFIGIGDKDFALKGAKALAESLKQAGSDSVTLKIYPGLEHLTVVQACLDDVFAFFNKSLDK